MIKVQIKEAAVASLLETQNAINNGANRIELNERLDLGGITPSLNLVQAVLQLVAPNNIPLVVMIRPRGGDFIYSTDEIQDMLASMTALAHSGVSSVTFGSADASGLDQGTMTMLIDHAKSLSLEVVMHMAFDEISNSKQQEQAIDFLYQKGIRRILTHGGPLNQAVNIDRLRHLRQYAPDDLVLLVGGGVTRDNYQEFADAIGTDEVHGTKIV